MLVHREHLLGLFVSLLTFYRKGALFSIPFGFYWIINTPDQMALWTPSRKNQKHRASETWEQWIQQKRKVIETVFSVLVDHYRITGIRANSIIGFEVALDGILLAYSLVTLGLVER
ncbi:putative transposase [Geobacillus stearothermophilus]|nr:putative transposase [Geobacillus stearothermophilus]